MNTTKIQVSRDVPKLFAFEPDQHTQRAALANIATDAIAEAYGLLIDATEAGITYSIKRSEEQRAPDAAERDVTYCVYVVTLEFIANVDTLL